MNLLEKFIYFLQGRITEPVPFGLFHIICIILTLGMVAILCSLRHKHSEKQLKRVLLGYGIIAFILEMLKQISWSFNYDTMTQLVTWDFEWYSFPFQLCTTPIYVCLICAFLKKSNIRDGLLSFIAFVTILGSISTILLPESCFVEELLVNIHTMWLHCGSFVVSIYLMVSKEVEIKLPNFIRALIVFIIFIGIAQIFNIAIYQSGILNGETFNMFYISPYFISSLPVFDVIQQNVPYFIFLILYIIGLSLGALIIFSIAKLIGFLSHKKTS